MLAVEEPRRDVRDTPRDRHIRICIARHGERRVEHATGGAEELRDEALAVSGLLKPRVGGPSVFPYQPAGLWEEAGTGKSYQQSKGDDLYRRSLYSFWRRTSPPPGLPEGCSKCTRR